MNKKPDILDVRFFAFYENFFDQIFSEGMLFLT